MMKITESQNLTVDPVIKEVREAKQALAEEHDFDVAAMARSLKEREIGDPRFSAKDSD
jgi:hypothetical protein